MTQIAIYRISRLVVVLRGDDARATWRDAVRRVRELAGPAGFNRSFAVEGKWYRTANRDGYMCGSYRATQLIAKKAAA